MILSSPNDRESEAAMTTIDMSRTATITDSPDPYVSRLEQHWEAIARQDPVVWGNDPGPWSDAEREEYQRRGYRQESELFTPTEIARMQQEAAQIVATVSPGQPGLIVESGTNVVRSIFRLHRLNPLFRAISRDPRIVAPVRQILGSDVYLHQTRINFKPPFDGKEFFWHSDFETWHVEDGMPRMRAVSVSIALTDNTEFNGPLMVIPGSHYTYIRCQGVTPANHFEQSLKKQEYGVPSRDALEMLVRQGGMVAPKGRAGSALMFDCNLMHGSASNLSPFPRNNLFFVYNSVENKLGDPFGAHAPRPEFLAEREIELID
jgi:ectoine hydroxylase